VPRASRKDRKIQRERAARALDRGLPTPGLDLRGPTGSRNSSGEHSGRPASVTATSSSSNPTHQKNRFAKWPIIVGVATLALLGIGLWRTLSTRSETGPDNPSAASARHVSPNGNPSAVAPVQSPLQAGELSR
jgi:hypothetical protein